MTTDLTNEAAQPSAVCFTSRLMEVEKEWADYNGHFNMAYYNVLFDKAADEAMTQLGLGPAYAASSGFSYFTLEVHVTYLREVHVGERVTITTQILGHDAKRIHFVQQMFRQGAPEEPAATSENMVMHIDMAARRSAPFPVSIAERIAAAASAHAQLAPPPQVGHQIALPEKS